MTSTSQIPQPPNIQINPQMAPSTSFSQILSEQTVLEQTTFTQPSQQLTIPDSEQYQPPPSNQIQTLSVSDQPSTSSDTEILDKPPLDILESDYIESELLKINSEMQSLVQLRRVPTLSVVYEDRWISLKSKASDLIDVVSKKCLRNQAAAVRRFSRHMHLAEQARGPLLYLANEPFYSESDYVTREAKVYKMLKQKLKESKAKEDSLMQRQSALEDFVKQQSELLKKQTEEISSLKALIQQPQQTNP
jgi:hypothetical protein